MLPANVCKSISVSFEKQEARDLVPSAVFLQLNVSCLPGSSNEPQSERKSPCHSPWSLCPLSGVVTFKLRWQSPGPVESGVLPGARRRPANGSAGCPVR